MRDLKDSGVEWLDLIPENWRVVPLKSLFLFGKGLPITKENLIEKGIPVISYGQIHAKWNSGVTIHEELKRFVSEEYIATNPNSLVKKGDFIMADTSEDREGCGNCAYVDTDEQIFAGYHTIILNSTDASNHKYLAYLFLTDPWRSQIRKRVSGVKLFSISRRILGDVSVILPSEEEALKIVAILDAKCAKIDTLISNQQAQIEKLKQYKQALITEVVTKGLNPNAPMKDSGVEWIGLIPETWSINRIKYICTFNSSVKLDLSPNDVVAYAPMECVKNGYMLPREISVSSVSSGLTFFKEGDIVMAKVTPCFENGNIAIATNLKNGVGFGSSELFTFRDYKVNAKWLMYFLLNRKFVQLACSTMTGTGGLKRVSPGFVDALTLAIPPDDEQNKVVAFLDNKLSKVDRLIGIKERKIEKLTVFKKSLIYEYVTGKKEVV